MRDFDKSGLKFVGINVLIAVFVLISILIGLILWLRTYTQHGEEVEVMDVRGLVLTEAEPLLADQGLHIVVIDSTYSDKKLHLVLWKDDVRESKIMATLLMPHDEMLPDMMEQWMQQISNMEMVEMSVVNLFQYAD